MNNFKRILLALDGSEQSLEAVRYVGKMLPVEQKIEFVLFHVFKKIPPSYYDMEKYPGYRQRLTSVHIWESQQKGEIEKFMEGAKKVLLDLGVSEESVVTTIQERHVGVARDIAFESQRDYDAVVVGSTGVSQLKDIVLGSITNKLIGRLAHVPLWVIGGAPRPGKILIAMDKSEGAMQAVQHVGKMVGDTGSEILLLHVIRGFQIPSATYRNYEASVNEEGWLEKANKDLEEEKGVMEIIFADAKKHLVEAGLSPDKVKGRIISDVDSRAATIVEEARQGGYDTIVVGRRGLSRIEEFFIGRVGHKVLQMSKEQAVWVVS